MIKEYGGLEKYKSKAAQKKHDEKETSSKESSEKQSEDDKEKTRKQVQDLEMMKEKIRQNKANKSGVISLMRKIVG